MVWPLHIQALVHDGVDVALVSVRDLVQYVVVARDIAGIRADGLYLRSRAVTCVAVELLWLLTQIEST